MLLNVTCFAEKTCLVGKETLIWIDGRVKCLGNEKGLCMCMGWRDYTLMHQGFN